MNAHRLSVIAAEAVLTVFRFHDKNMSSLDEMYQEAIQEAVDQLWHLRTQAECVQVAHLEIASDAAVTCAEVFNQRNPKQTINKRWTYNCVQNLLTAQLKPGLLLDGAVDRLVEPGKRAGDRLDDGEDDEEYDDDGSTRRGIRPRSHQGDTNDKSFNISSSTTLLGRDSPRPRSDDQSEFDHYDYDDGEADEAEADDEDDDDNGSSLTMSSRGDENDGGLDDSSSFAMSSKKGSKMAAGGYFTPAPAPKKTPKTPWTEGDIKLMVRLKDFDRLTHEEVAFRIGRGKGSVENKYGRVVKEGKWKRYAEACRKKSGHRGEANSTATTTTNKRRPHRDEDENDDDSDDRDEGVGPSPKKKQRC